jgi:hypothetical protein
MRNRMLGRFERLSGRCGEYDDIRDRFPLVAKSKEGNVGDILDVGEGESDSVGNRFVERRRRVLVVTESDEQEEKLAEAARMRTNLWPKDPRTDNSRLASFR